MKKIFFPIIMLFTASFILSGCVVRTYRKTQERVDQNLSDGNRGYLMATTAKIPEKDRMINRTTQVVEVELHSPIKFDRKNRVQASGDQLLLEDNPGGEIVYIEKDVDAAQLVGDFDQYTVMKNDTLQEISKKFYGTTKRWAEIYEANRGTLKGPDQIKAGQVLKIPLVSAIAVGKESLNWPTDNIK